MSRLRASHDRLDRAITDTSRDVLAASHIAYGSNELARCILRVGIAATEDAVWIDAREVSFQRIEALDIHPNRASGCQSEVSFQRRVSLAEALDAGQEAAMQPILQDRQPARMGRGLNLRTPVSEKRSECVDLRPPGKQPDTHGMLQPPLDPDNRLGRATAQRHWIAKRLVA